MFPSDPDPHFDYQHGILKNLPGFTDPKQLDDFERVEAAKAIFDLQTIPSRGSLT